MKKNIVLSILVMIGLASFTTSCNHANKQQRIENTEVVTETEPRFIDDEPVSTNRELDRDHTLMDQEDRVDLRESGRETNDEREAREELKESVEAVDSLEKRQEKEKIEEAIDRVK